MYKCNILWLDDEWKNYQSFLDIAEFNEWNIKPYAIRKEGLDELSAHPDKYDIVITDAQMPENNNNEEMGINGLPDVIAMANKSQIPVFVWTGQDYLKRDSTFKILTKNLFIKGSGNDEIGGQNELLEAIQKELENKEKTFAKNHYADVFVSLDKLGIRDDGYRILLSLLTAMLFPDKHKDFNADQLFNSLRQLIEQVFNVFIDKGILPDAFKNADNTILTESSKYLCGQEPKNVPYKHNGAIIPREWTFQFSSCLNSVQKHSHSHIASDNNMPNPKYMLFSYTLLICEFIIWADKYIQDHPDYDANKSEWISQQHQQPTQQND